MGVHQFSSTLILREIHIFLDDHSWSATPKSNEFFLCTVASMLLYVSILLINPNNIMKLIHHQIWQFDIWTYSNLCLTTKIEIWSHSNPSIMHKLQTCLARKRPKPKLLKSVKGKPTVNPTQFSKNPEVKTSKLVLIYIV